MRHTIDLTTGPIPGKLIRFALPLAAAGMLQQLFNSADIAVVGRFSGKAAMAAVGANSSMINLLVSLFTGLATGVNVVLAQAIGKNDEERIRKGVHTAIALGLVSGCIMMVAGIALARPLLELMRSPEDVIDLATVYLRIYFGGMPVLMLYNFGAAVLRSEGDTKRPLLCLLSAGIINVFLNLFFVIVCHLDVAGVAIATVVSNAVSALLVLGFLMKDQGPMRVDLKKLAIDPALFREMLHIGIPAGVQSMLFSISNVIIQSSFNSFGSACVAGNATGLNFESLVSFLNTAFNQAAMTFASQNYGAKKADRCRKTYRVALVEGVVSVGFFCLLIHLFDEPLVRIYTTDETVIPYALGRLRYAQRFQWAATFYGVASGMLRGIGYSIVPSIITIFGVCIFRLIWIATVFRANPTYPVLASVYPVTWTLTSVLMCLAYHTISRRVYRSISAG